MAANQPPESGSPETSEKSEILAAAAIPETPEAPATTATPEVPAPAQPDDQIFSAEAIINELLKGGEITPERLAAIAAKRIAAERNETAAAVLIIMKEGPDGPEESPEKQQETLISAETAATVQEK